MGASPSPIETESQMGTIGSGVLKTNAQGGGGAPQYDAAGNMKTHRVSFTRNNCSDALAGAVGENRNPANFNGFARYHRVKFTANGGVDNSFVQRNATASSPVMHVENSSDGPGPKMPNKPAVLGDKREENLRSRRSVDPTENSKAGVAGADKASDKSAVPEGLKLDLGFSRPTNFRAAAAKQVLDVKPTTGTKKASKPAPAGDRAVDATATPFSSNTSHRSTSGAARRSPSQDSIATTKTATSSVVSNRINLNNKENLQEPAADAAGRSGSGIVLRPRTAPWDITAKPTAARNTLVAADHGGALAAHKAASKRSTAFTHNKMLGQHMPPAGGKGSIRNVPLEMHMTRREFYG
eukprot:CAMPEP_0178981664 /NCGR_PEP_ID=MMETSP0795-20121207/66_1 /TAXON_ID=88552 /ORGANISM="Amoebophrya sp., Strain Ameob2" /LENGTH=352 /DNA_ID=CAMNT_0020672223 /DNA_START=73 /DNA_END=1131 /DNA_ORIENTATION=-